MLASALPEQDATHAGQEAKGSTLMTDQARDLASAAAYLDSMTQGANTLAHLLDARVPEATVALAVTSAARALGWSPQPLPVTPVALPVIQTCGDCTHLDSGMTGAYCGHWALGRNGARQVPANPMPGPVGHGTPPPDWCPLRTAIPLAKVWTREEVLSFAALALSVAHEHVVGGIPYVNLSALLDGEET